MAIEKISAGWNSVGHKDCGAKIAPVYISTNELTGKFYSHVILYVGVNKIFNVSTFVELIATH